MHPQVLQSNVCTCSYSRVSMNAQYVRSMHAIPFAPLSHVSLHFLLFLLFLMYFNGGDHNTINNDVGKGEKAKGEKGGACACLVS